MNIENKYIAVIGAGESGVGAALLAQKYGAQVFVSDFGSIKENLRSELSENSIEFEEKGHSTDRILRSDLVIKSPGIPNEAPIIQSIKNKGIWMLSEIEFASRFSNAKTICITGSNGKTTTTMLVHHILDKAGYDVGFGGNIGKSFARQLLTTDCEYYVLELSSFQLDDLVDFRADIAILLNITPDHLDRHKNISNYIAIKNKLNDSSEISIANENLKKVISHADYFFSSEGTLRKQNLSAIKMICSSLGYDFSEDEILTCFSQLPHRMETFHYLDENISFIDDSKATNVASSLEGLKSIDQSRSLIVICGGRSKNQDFEEYANYLNQYATNIFYFGESSIALKKLLDPSKSQAVKDLKKAVNSALKLLKNNSVVILSPACSSLDMFKSFSERGKKFKDLVLNAKI